MALPSVYTEGSLAAFMESELAAVGEDLTIGDTDLLVEAVNEIIGLLGHALSAETTTAGVMKVRALARWQAWLAARKAAARQFDTTASGRAFKLSQVWAQINYELSYAAAAASRYPEGADAGAGGYISLTTITSNGPYDAPVAGSEFG